MQYWSFKKSYTENNSTSYKNEAKRWMLLQYWFLKRAIQKIMQHHTKMKQRDEGQHLFCLDDHQGDHREAENDWEEQHGAGNQAEGDDQPVWESW